MNTFTRTVPRGNFPIPTYCIIACHVMWRELSHYAAKSANAYQLVFLEQGLHDTPDTLRSELQKAVDEADGRYEAILVGYGLCSNGIAGISAKKSRLVVPRGHDCITLFLGSKERYRDYFDTHPGTYWYNAGWIETGTQPSQARYETTLAYYVDRYGEDNAEYLMEMEQGWFKEYSNAAHIDQSLIDDTPYKDFTKKAADWLHWKYEELPADNSLFEDFLEGRWDDDRFLVLEPGETIQPSHDDAVLRKDPAPSAAPAVDATPAPAPDAATAES